MNLKVNNSCIIYSFIYLKYILLTMLWQLCQMLPLCSSQPSTPFPPQSTLSSCPWVVHISSLAFPFPILSLTSPCLFCTCQLCFLIPAPFPLFSPFLLPADNPPNDLRIYGSVPVLVLCLVCFCFCFLDSVVGNCEFVVILLFIFFIFFFLDKSL